eukprot:snap_masked-scaffold_46-processed-gene-0.40-mRNA-1 protein AED:1.00 eAED:1.00 QI:0/0/0/0/1/1/2/0/67
MFEDQSKYYTHDPEYFHCTDNRSRKYKVNKETRSSLGSRTYCFCWNHTLLRIMQRQKILAYKLKEYK